MSYDKEKEAYRQLLQGISDYVNKKVADSGKDITFTAKIVSIQDDGGYVVNLNGKQYSNIYTIGGTCSVNETVKVLIPQGQYNNMFILKGGSGGGSGEISGGVLSVNGKTGAVTLNASDIDAVPSSSQETIDIDFSAYF